MTAQIADSVTIDGIEYSIAGVNGSGLFEPGGVGLEPCAMSTACYRGFICWYALVEDGLVLTRLVLAEGTGRHGKPIKSGDEVMGSPLVRIKGGWLEGSYEVAGLASVVEFSGGLLLGADFVEATYRHMGYHPAWKYRRVLELVASSGRVTELLDRSEFMAKVRDRVVGGDGLEAESIKQTFTLDYRRSGL